MVGETARLAPELGWFERLPLAGRTVVVTRAAEQAGPTCAALEALGAEAVRFPVIAFAPPPDPARVERAVADLGSFDAVIFTSANGVARFLDRIFAAGRDGRAFGGALLCAIGSATAEALAERRLVADLVPERFVAEGLLEALAARFPGGVAGQRFLVPRALEARELLPEALREQGAHVEVVPVYETVAGAADAPLLASRLEAGEVDAVTFTSSSTVTRFAERFGEEETRRLLAATLVACIGPVTSRTARDLGLTVGLEARTHTVAALIGALAERLGGGSPARREEGGEGESPRR